MSQHSTLGRRQWTSAQFDPAPNKRRYVLSIEIIISATIKLTKPLQTRRPICSSWTPFRPDCSCSIRYSSLDKKRSPPSRIAQEEPRPVLLTWVTTPLARPLPSRYSLFITFSFSLSFFSFQGASELYFVHYVTRDGSGAWGTYRGRRLGRRGRYGLWLGPSKYTL